MVVVWCEATASIHGQEGFLFAHAAARADSRRVRTRQRTAAPAEVAHRSISVAHLGNIAMMVGRKIRWDRAKEEILDDDTASRLLCRAKREPWSV